MIRGYHQIRNDQISTQRKVGDTLSQVINRCTQVKEIEVAMGGFRSDLEEQMAKQTEEVSILKSQMRAQKFEIETDLMKKIKYHQSQHDIKLDEFYKFKADIYSYLDGKYETITTTYGTKIKSLSEFIESAETKIRQLMDVKANHELQFDEFISKYNSKLSLIEDNLHQLNNKSQTYES